jgi:hypothetical protein
MGNFYTQVLLRSSEREKAIGLLKDVRRRAYVSPEFSGWLLVLDARIESQNVDDLDDLSYTLAHELDCNTLGILNHDDDHLLIRLFSPDGYIGNLGATWATCAALRELAEAKCSTLSIWLTFLRPYIFEVSRHQKLCRLLGLPDWTAGLGYRYYEKNDEPPGTPELLKI